MATPFPFTTGQVLTAAQMNAITELIINDKTASYTLAAGDAGEYVVMNSASTTTITVNNSIFTASQVIYIVNKGSASTTITAGAGVTISTSGSLVVPANGSGRLLALSASAFIYEAGGITTTAAGLTLITSATFSAAATVSMAASTFTTTYQNYLVLVAFSATSTDQNVSIRVNNAGSPQTAANYYGSKTSTDTTNAVAGVGSAAATSHNAMALRSTWPTGGMAITVVDPAASGVRTSWHGTFVGASNNGAVVAAGTFGCGYDVAEANDGLTFVVGGTMTGNYRVYGYLNS